MDLSQLPGAPVKPTGETLRPLLTGQAHVDIYTAFGLLDDHEDRVRAYAHALRAVQLQADVRAQYMDVVDAYAAEHGIKGRHRRTSDRGGRPYIAMDRLRLVSIDGDRGRYYSLRDFMPCQPLTVSVVDQDSGRTVYRAINNGIAEQWIREHESAPAV